MGRKKDCLRIPTRTAVYLLAARLYKGFIIEAGQGQGTRWNESALRVYAMNNSENILVAASRQVTFLSRYVSPLL